MLRTVTFAEIPQGAIFGDGKEGVYKKVPAFPARPNGFRSHPEANAWELDASTLKPESPAWFADDCDELVYPLPGGLGRGTATIG
jgi:hypothetical protein